MEEVGWGGQVGVDQGLSGEQKAGAGKKVEKVNDWTRFCGTWGSTGASFGPPGTGVSVP